MPYTKPDTSPSELLGQLKALLAGTLAPDSTISVPDTPDEDGSTDNSPTPINPLAAKARAAFKKRQAQHRFDKLVTDHGLEALAEDRSHNYACTELVPIDHILDDPNFKNFRLKMDPTSLTELETSINLEGLKVPIVVVAAAVPDYYHVRAGFRRTLAVRHLGWKDIPAVVLPVDTPEAEEYWINIIENTAREKLSTYELANAAKMMRDRFGVKPADFARKSGHSLDYVTRLLGCLDRLPVEVLHSWQRGDKVPLDILVKLSTMTHQEAIKNLRLWFGQHRITADEALARLKKPPSHHSDKLWTVAGIERTQKLMIAIKVSNLDPKTKRLCMDVVEFCQGGRKRIEGIVDEDHRLPTREITMPDPEPDEIRPLQDRPDGPKAPPALHEISPAEFAPTVPGTRRKAF